MNNMNENIARFHLERVGNPSSENDIQKWLLDIQHLPEWQQDSVIEEYYIYNPTPQEALEV